MPPVVPVTNERVPRRGRYLVPLTTPRRAEVLAVLAIVTLLAGALFAQVTLVAAALFHAVTKVSRLRPVWLAAPAAAGLAWALAVGPAIAAAGLGAAPAAVTAVLQRSFASPTAIHHLAQLPGVVAPRLAGQLPLALIAGAAVAAFSRWLDWFHADEWHLAPARPGLLGVTRREWHTWSIRSGGVVTRDGASLGIDASTGRPATLSWQQARSGVLVTAADPSAVEESGLRVMYAAVRRRQPVVVVDLTGSPALHEAVAAVCAACDAPLQVYGPSGGGWYEPGHTAAPLAAQSLTSLRATAMGRWLGPSTQATTRINLAEVVRCRAVALFPLDPGLLLETTGPGRAAATVADLVTVDIAASYTGPQATLAPAGLVWVNGCEAVDPAALATLATAGQHGPLAWVLGTAVASTAATLAARTGVCVAHRVADPVLAGQLAELTGTRLAPAGHIAPGTAGPLDVARVPVVPAESLGTLAEGDFVLVRRAVPGRVAGRTTGGTGVCAVRARAVTARVPARPRGHQAAAQPAVRTGRAR